MQPVFFLLRRRCRGRRYRTVISENPPVCYGESVQGFSYTLKSGPQSLGGTRPVTAFPLAMPARLSFCHLHPAPVNRPNPRSHPPRPRWPGSGADAPGGFHRSMQERPRHPFEEGRRETADRMAGQMGPPGRMSE